MASVVGGVGVGSLIGYLWRGPLAIIPGAMTYGLIGGLGQVGFNMAEQYRLKIGAEMLQQNSEPIPSKGFRELSYSPEDPKSKQSLDPLGDLIAILREKLTEKVPAPEWASPLLHAINMQHRKMLNYKIIVLEEQIEKLEKDLQSKS